MARHRRTDAPLSIRVVASSSRYPRPHWVRTVCRREAISHPVYGEGVSLSWSPEFIADAPAPGRSLRRRDRRSIRRARNVDLPALIG